MTTATLLPIAGSSFLLTNLAGSTPDLPTPHGDADIATCLRVSGDGKYLEYSGFNTVGFLVDASAVPGGATITDVSIVANVKSAAAGPSTVFFAPTGFTVGHSDLSDGAFQNCFDESPLGPQTYPGLAYVDWHVTAFANASYTGVPVTSGNNPATDLAWTKADLTTQWFGLMLNSFTPDEYDAEYFAVVVTYTLSSQWYYNPTTDSYQYSASDPGSPWIFQASAPVPTLPAAEVPTLSYSGTTSPRNGTTSVASPANGCAGTPVTLVGSGFGTGATVTFGGVSATSVVVVDQHTITCVTPAHADGAVNIVVTNPDTTAVTFTNGFTYGTPWWTRFVVEIVNGIATVRETHANSCSAPSLGNWTQEGQTIPADTWWYNSATGTYRHQVTTPGSGWTPSGGGPAGDGDSSGWYDSTYGYGGSIDVIANGRPKDPRVWANIAAWATGNTGCFGGSPAASCIFQNHLVYPATYTVATDYPPIRVHNGSFDRELCRLPPTTAGTIPKAVMSMLATNGTIYLTTFDSGTTSADWRGRVFELNLDSGNLTLLGAQFAAGEMPYALAWHLGRLWCGTNNGIGTVGKVYSFRPGIDTTWVLEHSLATDSVGGVCSMLSYNGKLYIGSDAAAGTFAKVIVRDGAGVYTTSLTATGGTARVNNAFLALTVFGTNLYASYFNNDTTAVSKIYKFDNSSWSTVYTGASATLRPYIGLLVDGVTLFAIGGGMSLAASLVSTLNGTSWTDLTPQLPETNRTFQPIFGTVVL